MSVLMSSLIRVWEQLPYIYQVCQTPKNVQQDTKVIMTEHSILVKIGDMHEGSSFDLVFNGQEGALRSVVQQKYSCTNYDYNGLLRSDLLLEIQTALSNNFQNCDCPESVIPDEEALDWNPETP